MNFVPALKPVVFLGCVLQDGGKRFGKYLGACVEDFADRSFDSCACRSEFYFVEHSGRELKFDAPRPHHPRRANDKYLGAQTEPQRMFCPLGRHKRWVFAKSVFGVMFDSGAQLQRPTQAANSGGQHKLRSSGRPAGRVEVTGGVDHHDNPPELTAGATRLCPLFRVSPPVPPQAPKPEHRHSCTRAMQAGPMFVQTRAWGSQFAPSPKMTTNPSFPGFPPKPTAGVDRQSWPPGLGPAQTQGRSEPRPQMCWTPAQIWPRS